MRWLAVAVALLAGMAQANTGTSLRPAPREPIAAPAPARAVIVDVSDSQLAPRRSLRPDKRRGSGARSGTRRNTFGQQLREAFRQKPKAQGAIAPATRKGSKRVAKGLQGSVCGDPNIRGVKISRIPGKIRGCGLDSGVKVTAVSGVALTQHATIDCTTAKALNAWVEQGVKPVVGRRGGGVKSLRVVAHYACRTRNNKRGGKISEHGRGRAVDIAAINLKDGSSMTVLKGWRSAKNGPALKKMHKAACGPFGTVLGPNADRYHQDHFHFDTARYRSGRYCR
ncbi:extensin-like domain-containing protein [Litoreibacter arenae]|uniref:Putative extensin protein n=1 Tax=Litoreibacter arenae DSM 19593 TaxID=1123360 RepID=S9S3D4_9RHOB|nr:extensin family protein [Litoreibacter arenae]EPX80679.1 putative extensin protein [Litoreibacter arenae DSM 19593]